MADIASPSNEGGFVNMAVAVVLALVVVGVVMVPIIATATSHTEIVDIPDTYNENPIGDLRLTYSTESDVGIWADFSHYGGGVLLSKGLIIDGERQPIDTDVSITDLSADQILFASDNVSVTIINSELILNVNGKSYEPAQPIVIEVTDSIYVFEADAETSVTQYTFVYYPDSEGTYANYASYPNDNGTMYATGVFAGVCLSSQEGDMVGVNEFGFSATVITTDDDVSGVHYEVIG